MYVFLLERTRFPHSSLEITISADFRLWLRFHLKKIPGATWQWTALCGHMHPVWKSLFVSLQDQSSLKLT